MILDFRTKTFTTDVGVPTPITFAKSGHPCMSLLAYEEDEDTKEIYQMDRFEEEDQDSGSDLEKMLSRPSANVVSPSTSPSGSSRPPGTTSPSSTPPDTEISSRT